MSKLLVGLGLATISQMFFVLPSLGQYQGNEGDIVVIGESPEQWARFRSYWQELLQLNPTPQQAASDPADNLAANDVDPAKLEAELKKNLIVSDLKFTGIRSLSGSSQVVGTIKNKNPKPVTVTSVSFEILDKSGKMLRTGSATPQPSTIAPGQSVTFSTDLFGFPRRSSYKVQLTDSPFTIQGGV